jgi:hypothetical protein
MKRIEYQLRRCIYDNVAYMPKLEVYPKHFGYNRVIGNRMYKEMKL